MTAPWTDAATLKARPDMADLTTDQCTAVIAAASEVLDNLSMHQFGTHDDTVRPEGCGRGCDVGAPSERAVVGWGLSQPLARVVGPWPLPGPYGGLVDFCGSCHAIWTTGIPLLRPVTGITSIRVDGAALDASTYQVWDDSILLRVDGKVWPRCQTMTADPATDVGTFQVEYVHGIPVSAMAMAAATSLAAELAKLWDYSAGTCRLPQRVTQVVRQGVTVAVAIDPLEILRQGGTGLSDVDMWLASLRSPRRARIATPGVSSQLHRRTI